MKKNGKNICKQLKAIRKRIAEENNIPLVQEECTHKGDCNGTCPHCEQEVRYLESELSARQRLGKAVSVAGLAAGLSLAPALTSCSSIAHPVGIVPANTEDTLVWMGEEAAPIPGEPVEVPTEPEEPLRGKVAPEEVLMGDVLCTREEGGKPSESPEEPEEAE